jgi:hypothetical protein
VVNPFFYWFQIGCRWLPSDPDPVHIRLSEDEVKKIVTGYGFRKGKVADIGEYNYLMTFYYNW